jgi:hypothetical protein
MNKASKFTRYATNRDRAGWCAEYVVEKGRARGKLFSGTRVIREDFSVAIKDGKFAVDIGTGSGVKVNFTHYA